jgi:hypothetical protein
MVQSGAIHSTLFGALKPEGIQSIQIKQSEDLVGPCGRLLYLAMYQLCHVRERKDLYHILPFTSDINRVPLVVLNRQKDTEFMVRLWETKCPRSSFHNNNGSTEHTDQCVSN